MDIRPAAKRTRTARVKQAIKAVAGAAESIVPAALKPAPKDAERPPTTFNPLQEMSDSMLAVERDMRNDFGDDEYNHIPQFKRGRLSGRGFLSQSGFSTHALADERTHSTRCDDLESKEGGFWDKD